MIAPTSERACLSCSCSRRLKTYIDDLTTHTIPNLQLLHEHYSPAGIVPNGDRQEETGDIELESRKPRKTATRIDSKLLEYPPGTHLPEWRGRLLEAILVALRAS
jgi:hypothetical protein